CTAVAVSALADHASVEVPVRGKVPDPRPDSFVTVRRTGGVRQSMVSDAAQLTVECWASSDEAAHDLAQTCRAILLALSGSTVDDVPVYRVSEVGGPALLPDPLSGQPRCTFTVLLAA